MSVLRSSYVTALRLCADIFCAAYVALDLCSTNRVEGIGAIKVNDRPETAERYQVL